jgi:hypothetical protein
LAMTRLPVQAGDARAARGVTQTAVPTLPPPVPGGQPPGGSPPGAAGWTGDHHQPTASGPLPTHPQPVASAPSQTRPDVGAYPHDPSRGGMPTAVKAVLWILGILVVGFILLVVVVAIFDDADFSFEEEFENGMDTAAPYASYETITDDTDTIRVEVPSAWDDVDGAPLVTGDGERVGVDVRAAGDLERFQTTWNEPGMIFSALSTSAQQVDEESVLDELQDDLSRQCTYEGREPYSDPAYTGQFDRYTDCGGTGATYVVVGAVPSDDAFVLRVQVQANADRDFEALDRILDSFVATGQV